MAAGVLGADRAAILPEIFDPSQRSPEELPLQVGRLFQFRPSNSKTVSFFIIPCTPKSFSKNKTVGIVSLYQK
jgi:hypothetical protein